MSEEEKKAIENLKKDCYECAQDNDLFEDELFCSRYDVLTVLKLIKKQDEMIDLMAEIIEKEDDICDEISTDECSLECKECIKEIVRKKIEEEK